jgi:hypothetical protein
MGFFAVGRETLVGLFSTVVTYLIIIIQFDQVTMSSNCSNLTDLL